MERRRDGVRFSQHEKELQLMSIFGNIMSAIFKSATPSAASGTAAPSGPAPRQASTAPGSGAAGSSAPTPAATTTLDRVDVADVLTKLASQNEEDLDWRRSIVDLMKLLNLDSSLAARKQLARELRYTGDMGDSASMNIWLHRQVMQKLADNGGKVPSDLMGR
jgi:hypothetical protein